MPLCLIVDDSKVVRKMARRMVETLGFTADEAEHGEDALVKCKQAMPDCILLDWHMPVMNGLEFLKSFRALPGNDATKVIFCTTETDILNIMQAMESGANEYVMKPYNEDILKDKLSQIGAI